MTTATTTATRPFEGTYTADDVHSSFGFGVKHMGVSTFRGTLSDVDATLTAEDGELSLVGAARPESISIVKPEQFRAHVLGPEFFDIENHPEIGFRSTSIELGEDGSARIEGELTIKGITRPIVATGTYRAPEAGPMGPVGAFELEAKFDRREFEFNWNMEIPSGGVALDYEVTLQVHVELLQPAAE
jgi:polyisoprenoid-binding protein YceI